MQEAAEGELGGWRSAMDPMDERYDDYLDGDQRPPDQRTPPNTPPPQVEGGAHAAAATGTAFEVNAVWRMPRHPTYEHPLCRFMALDTTINRQGYWRRSLRRRLLPHIWNFFFSFFSSDSPTDLDFTVAMVDSDGRPAGAAVEVGASGVGSKRAGEVAVQLDEVLDR